ncbi:hypothetical protein Droror1_Dr00026576 [Drosera rotundifolia]
MKVSLKYRDETNQSPLIRAKLPITILSLPFLSGVVAGDTSDLAFSVRTNFASGPSLSFSYHPVNSGHKVANGSIGYPFSVALKSGIGLFGSPRESPLVFSAEFKVEGNGSGSSVVVPRFWLNLRPQLGNFSLRKSTSSSSLGAIPANGVAQNGEISSGFGKNADLGDGFGKKGDLGSGFVMGKSLEWGDLKKVEAFGGKNGLSLSGILVMAKTTMPLTSRAKVNFRWGVSFSAEGNGRGSSGASRPVLLLNKIGIERVEEAKRKEEKETVIVANGDLELLKGMCGWMSREMDDLQRGNREIKQALEGIRLQGGSNCRARGDGGEYPAAKRAVSVPSDSAGDAERWRSRKSAAAALQDTQNSATRPSEVENELQRAIKAAGASP